MTETKDSDQRIPPSFVPWVMFLIVVWLPILIAFGIFCLWWWNTSSAVSEKLAELRAAELPTNLRELNEFYQVPDGVEDKTNLWTAAFDSIERADLRTRGQGLPFIGIDASPVPPLGEIWPQLEAAQTLLEELQPEMQIIHAAGASSGRYRSLERQTLFDLRHDLHLAGDAARLLQLDAHVAAHLQDDTRVLQDLRSLLSLRDALCGEVTLLGLHVCNAFHAQGCVLIEEFLPHLDWRDSELVELQEMLRTADFQQNLLIALQGERSLSLTEADQFPFFVSPNKLEVLKTYDRVFNATANSPLEAIHEIRTMDDEVDAISDNDPRIFSQFVAASTVVSMKYGILSALQQTVRQRSLIAILAAQRHRLRHGELPNSLAEIDEDLLTLPVESFIDPFTGEALRFKNADVGITIYSVGSNLVDDDGSCEIPERGDSLDIGATLPR